MRVFEIVTVKVGRTKFEYTHVVVAEDFQEALKLLAKSHSFDYVATHQLADRRTVYLIDRMQRA